MLWYLQGFHWRQETLNAAGIWSCVYTGQIQLLITSPNAAKQNSWGLNSAFHLLLLNIVFHKDCRNQIISDAFTFSSNILVTGKFFSQVHIRTAQGHRRPFAFEGMEEEGKTPDKSKAYYILHIIFINNIFCILYLYFILYVIYYIF